MGDLDLRDHALGDLGGLVRRGELSAVEVLDAAAERIEALNPTLNAWAALDLDGARAQAAAIDARVAAGEDVGPLAGVPLGVKDLEPAAGFATGYGSALLADDPPATEDSILVTRLRAAGCVVVGKTTTPEHGWQGDTISPHWGATRNPWDPTRSPGGSSGGSAVALATGMVALATGSDGGGSIRIPAALCGLTGLKPTHGVVPLGGPNPPAGGFLTVRGPMARTAADTALALAVAAGPDLTDCFSVAVDGLAALATEPLRPALPARVVWAPAPGFPVDAEVAAACAALVERLAGAGTEVVEVDRIFASEPIGDWFTLWTTYRQRAHGHLRTTPDWERIDAGLRSFMDHAHANVGPLDVMAALDSIHRHNLDVAALLDQAPIVLLPTVAGQTARSGEQGTVDGEATMFWAPFTQFANLTRHPAGSVRAGTTADGMPIGLQVVGRPFRDAEVLSVLAALEGLAPQHTPTWPA